MLPVWVPPFCRFMLVWFTVFCENAGGDFVRQALVRTDGNKEFLGSSVTIKAANSSWWSETAEGAASAASPTVSTSSDVYELKESAIKTKENWIVAPTLPAAVTRVSKRHRRDSGHWAQNYRYELIQNTVKSLRNAPILTETVVMVSLIVSGRSLKMLKKSGQNHNKKAQIEITAFPQHSDVLGISLFKTSKNNYICI